MFSILVETRNLSKTTNDISTKFAVSQYCGCLWLNKKHTFVGLKIRDHSIFLHNSYSKIAVLWELEFMDLAIHEKSILFFDRP